MYYPQPQQAAGLGPMEQFRQQLMGYCQQDLSQNAQRNPIRGFHYQLCADNGFNSAAFQDYIANTARYAYFLMMSQRMQPETAISQAAQEMGGLLSAVRAMQYRQQTEAMIQQLGPTYKNDLNLKLQTYEQLLQQLAMFEQRLLQAQQQQPMAMHGGMAYGHYSAPPPPMQMGTPMVQQYPMTGAPVIPQMGMGGIVHQPMGVGVPMPQQRRSLPAGGLGSVRPANRPVQAPVPQAPRPTNASMRVNFEEVTMSPQGEFSHTASSQIPKPPPRQGYVEPKQQVQPQRKALPPPPGRRTEVEEVATVPFQQLPPVPVQVPEPTAPALGYLEHDGIQIRMADGSPWKPSVDNPEDRFPLLFDHNTHGLFHVRTPDGKVKQILKERTEEMGYLEHELNPELKQQHRNLVQEASGSKVVPNWGLLNKFRTDPRFKASEELDPDATPEAETQDPETAYPWIYGPMQANSLEEAVRHIALTRDAERIYKNGMPVEYVVRVTSPMLTGHNHIGIVKALSKTTKHEQFVALLDDKAQKIEADVLMRIDGLMAEGVNSILNHELGISDITIDSYIEDIPELRKVLEEEFGAITAQAFDKRVATLAAQKLDVLTGADFSEYLSRERIEGADDIGSRLLVFSETVVLTRVPWSSADVSVDLSKGGLVTADALPNLFQALDAMFRRNSATPRRFLLEMNDGERYSVYAGAFSHSFLIYPCNE